MTPKNRLGDGGDSDSSANAASNSESVDNLLAAEEQQPEPVMFCDSALFDALLRDGTVARVLFGTSPQSSSATNKNDGSVTTSSNNNDGVQWFACVLWNSNVLKEIEVHEQVGHRLFSSMGLGRLMMTCVKEQNQSWPGVRFMDWKKPFMMVEIVDDNFGISGCHPYLRARETTSTESIVTGATGSKSRMWDLVVYEECKDLADEMIRRYSEGVKTTVVLWGAVVQCFPKSWIDDKNQVLGEIFLKSRNETEDPLSVLIFHHENMSKARSKCVQSFTKKSELWKSFQDSSLPYKWFSNSSFLENTSHFSFHVTSYHEKNPILEAPPFVIPTSSKETRLKSATQAMNANDDNSNDQVEERAVSESQLQYLATQDRSNSVDNMEVDVDLEKTVLADAGEKNDIEQGDVSGVQSSSNVSEKKSDVDDDNRRQTRAQTNIKNSDTSSPVKKKSKRDCKDASSVQEMQTDDELGVTEENEDQYRFTARLDEI